jgi:hypothetical protein
LSTEDSQHQQQELDLLELNPDKIETTDDGSLKQEGEQEFDPGEYAGFPMEAWNRYFGSINDKRQSRSASLAKLSNYSVRYNSASADSPFPKFKVIALEYSFITKKAWEKRRKELAEIEDLERQQQIQITRVAEMQESLRLRIFARNKPRGMVTNRDDPNKAQLEEIQNNMKFFADISNDIGQRLAEKRQESDLYAFQMYFHKNKDVYDQIMNEDLDDILRACDWKQIYGSSNLRLSPPSPIQGPQQAIQ